MAQELKGSPTPVQQNFTEARSIRAEVSIDPNKIVDPNAAQEIIQEPLHDEDSVLSQFDKSVRGGSKNQRDTRDITRHTHDGANSQPIQMRHLKGLFQVVSAVPTSKPVTMYEQIVIYTSGSTYRLYWYDWVNDAWHYATGT